jgi:hypothetical protein
MYLTGINKGQGLEATGELHLVDLAGSERLARSQVMPIFLRNNLMGLTRCWNFLFDFFL